MSKTVYHGSANLFEHFSLASAGSIGRATNGALGVWVTPEARIAKSFCGNYSGYLYTLHTCQASVKKLPLQWLMDRHDEAMVLELSEGRDAAIQFYDRIRLSFLAQGHTEIWIEEADGSAPTRIVLHPDAVGILSVEKIELLGAA